MFELVENHSEATLRNAFSVGFITIARATLIVHAITNFRKR